MNLIIRRLIAFLLLISASALLISPLRKEKDVTVFATQKNEDVTCSLKDCESEIKVKSRLIELLFGKTEDEEPIMLIPGGAIFGAKIKQSYVSVQNPGEIKDLKPGDKIISLNGRKISSVGDVKEFIESLDEKSITLVCERGGKEVTVKITPKKQDGEYKLGLILKDGAAGIGTITYIDPKTGTFGGLGHGICDTDTGEVIKLSNGQVCGVILSGVKKGENGRPGELSGLLTDKVSGDIYTNTECGLFGRLDKIPDMINATPIKIAHREDVHEGDATILSTVKAGGTKEYKIKILDIDKNSTETKSFKIKVTDPTLIAITGGVVRGMSGSPIIQDGKLVGAVTHVMVADPTEGYGIFIENMLNASASTRNELPAA
ncbi:MAG: SpoIVB peptidase [Clostridia bacterium]|nr:SpoIVB peptidase [Clostridia bacterium]